LNKQAAAEMKLEGGAVSTVICSVNSQRAHVNLLLAAYHNILPL